MDGGRGEAAVAGPRQESLPEIPLEWKDFMWALEKLRHKPYSKKSSERDWFRINPLDMVLLGCQSVLTNSATKRENVTMVLAMSPLAGHMLQRPRYWLRTFSVLCATITCEDIPAVILQRCCSMLLSLWRRIQEVEEFHPFVLGWCAGELDVITAIEKTLSKNRRSLGVPLCSELQRWASDLDRLLTMSNETCQRLTNELTPLDEARSSNQDAGLRGILTHLLQQCGSVEKGGRQLQVQIYSMYGSTSDAGFKIDTDSVLPLVSTIMESLGGHSSPALCQLLALLQLLAVRWREMASPLGDSPSAQMRQASLESSPEQREDEDTGSQREQGDEREEREGEEEVSSNGAEEAPPPSPQLLLDSLTTSLKKWRDMGLATTDHQLSSVATKLLSLVHTVLSFKPLSESLPEAVDFLDKPLSLLTTYSMEGYLSDSPAEFMEQLLEFITSLVEQGSSLNETLQTNLPNLFGPAFGIRSHAVSCKLLEFGYLSVCSQHKKTLLTKGLRFVMEVFHLFPPLDKLAAEATARALRLEALSVSEVILEQLLRQVVPEDGRSSLAGLVDDVSQSDEETNQLQYQNESDVSVAMVTDEMRKDDKRSRLQVLLKLLELSCDMIRNGEDITFLFASTLPKLFRAPSADNVVKFNKQKLQKFFGEEPPPPPSQIKWKVDKKELAIQLLDLAAMFVENNAASPFQLCGIVIPKLAKHLDEMNLSDEEKMSLALEVLKVTRETLEAGHDVNDLISHGIDLISILLPKHSSCEELRVFISQIASHLAAFNLSSMLFLIKNACQFMKSSFHGEEEEVQELFKSLLFRGKRDEIRGIFRVCKEPIKSDQFVNIRRYLYGYTTGKLSHRQLLALCEILIHAMDIDKPQKVVREIITNVEEEDKSVVEERNQLERAVLTRLASPCLLAVETALKENRFKRDIWEEVEAQLAQIALFRTLFQSEFPSFGGLSQEQLLTAFRGKFPTDVLFDEDMMRLLSLSATRIEHMQVPRYDSLRAMLAGILRHFLSLDTPLAAAATSSEGGGEGEGGVEMSSPLKLRMSKLEEYIEQLPRNLEDRKKLVEHGYSNSLWEKDLSLSVKTDGSLSLEENLRQNLLACYTELVDILKQMAVTHVSVDGEMVKCVELFTDDLSLTDLKGRRAVAIRAIDQKRGGLANEGHFYERKIALLAKEDQIEADFEKMSKSAIKPKLFRAVLNTKFLDCAKCCGGQIIGCYAPTGEHCERPLEIGLRSDSGIASIYDESGVEIENAELLFTEEGAYFFKAYSNGHPYDTSQVWAAMFTALLKEAPSSLVPAIVVPNGYPNQRTWEALRRCVSTEMTGSILNCRHDFSPEWRTYYDHRPERVRMGMDIVLHPGFSLTSDPSRPVLHRQRSKFTKDLAGLIFEEAMQSLLQDEWLKQFKFLGKVMSQYISVCVNEGVCKVSIIHEGFNYERWKKTTSKNRQLPGNLSSTSEADVPEKQAVVGRIASFLDAGITRWCEEIDLLSLCSSNHRQLLELKGFLERSSDFRAQGTLSHKLRCIRQLLAQCMFTVPLLSLSTSLQEEVIHWVFRNEDRVWRYRGGRDGHETLQQFMNFLGREQVAVGDVPHLSNGGDSEQSSANGEREKKPTASKVAPRLVPNPYAGVVVFCVPMATVVGEDIDVNSFQVEQMVAYAVGEMEKPAASEDDDGSTHVTMVMKPATAQTAEEKEEEEEKEGDKNVDENLVPRKGVRDWSHDSSCYEVVTAWVHPSYRGLGLSTLMYLQIVRQVPARLVVCDMVVGSVERIVHSSRLLRWLDRLRVLSLVVRTRQLSYNVTTQTGTSEQFEKVLFNVRPMRFSLWVYDVLSWCHAHPKTTCAIATIPTAAAVVAMGTIITLKLVR